jgi:opacity protein-like surface antigen
MRKLLWTGVFVFVMSLAGAAAEDPPKFEVFGGVSWLHIDNIKVAGIKQNYMGWDTEAQYNFNKILGVTADISGNYGRLLPDTPTRHSYSFVFGPTLSYRAQHSTIFAHTLFGANTENILMSAVLGSSDSDTAFAMAWGGGIDLKVNDTFAVRLGQLDWLYTRHNFSFVLVNGKPLADHQNNIRYAGGVVINFGRR